MLISQKYNREYAKGLAQYGFEYHSIIRPQSRINWKRCDWYMQNLIKQRNVDIIFACIEPDICKITNKPFGSNHIHFAWAGAKMHRKELVKKVRCKDFKMLEPMPIYNGMDYFSKHLGKSLSYHNIYV